MFITSNSEVTGFNLPTVMVILIHKNKTEKKTGLREQTRVSSYIQMGFRANFNSTCLWLITFFSVYKRINTLVSIT
ncbi:hypothetical protein Mapa_018574 [Marchantia paleacea]|nr:hypothetical protein Mapa_018574 [Marchantia paleacea]